MNFPLLSLELHKNRLAAAAVLLAFVVTVPVSRLVSATTGMEPARALEAVLLVWMILGSPFAAALTASTAGAASASPESRDAEGLWPVSPLRRAAASVAAAALLAAAVTAVLVASAAAFGALGWLDTTSNPAMNWGHPFWLDRSMFRVFLVGMADVLLTCWVLSYLLGHGVAGGLAGVVLCATTGAAAAIGLGLQVEHKYWGLDMLPAYTLLAVLILALKAAAVAAAAAWRERAARPKAAVVSLLAAALLIGPAGGWSIAELAYRDLASRLKPSDWRDGQSLLYPSQSTSSALPGALKADGREIPVDSGAGALYLAGPDGLRELLPRRRTGVLEALFNDIREGTDAARAADGTLWATRWDYTTLELWREKNGAMELVRREKSAYSGSMDRHAGSLFLSYWIPAMNSEQQFVRVEDYAAKGKEAPVLNGLSQAIAAADAAAGAATADCAPKNRCLRRGGRTWIFPAERYQPGAPALPYVVGGKTIYLTGVRDKGAAWAMAALPDGKVVKAWTLRKDSDGSGYFSDFRVLPDGTPAAKEPNAVVAWIGPDLKAGRLDCSSFRPKGAHGGPDLVRLAKGRVWLLWSNALQEATVEGRVLAEHPVPAHPDWRAMNDGVLVQDEGRMSFVGWDGTVKPLRAPSS